MRILLTNDDGIHAEGLAALERIARTISDDVWVVAPETDQSGYAHSLSLSQPLRLQKIGEKHFAVSGTPTDCVIMGVRRLLPEPPDLILSGVNSGSNIADDITYSGTVAGAMEGALLGIRSAALSQAYIIEDQQRIVPYETSEALAPALLEKLLGLDLPAGIFFNLNFPSCPADEVGGHARHQPGQARLQSRHRGAGRRARAALLLAALRTRHDGTARRHRPSCGEEQFRLGDAAETRSHRA